MCRRAAILIALALLNAAALADVLPPRLTSISPPAGQVGTSFKAVFSGNNLEDALQVRFAHPGISAKPVGGNGLEASFEVTIAPDVPPGQYDARVVGRNGISNVRAIWVGQEKIVPSPTDNTSLDRAITLGVNCATSARCAAGTMHFYAVDLTLGQHVVFESVTDAIDSRMAPVMLLSDQEHRELARSRDGGILDFVAPADGRYFLCLHDLLFRGGGEYFYHLAVSTRPHLHSIFPPVGRAGSQTKYTVFGYNLPQGTSSPYADADGQKLQQLEVEIALPPRSLSQSVNRFEYRLKNDEGTSNPVEIFIADCQAISRFSRNNQPPMVEFSGKKGQPFWFEIYSDRLGIPAAPDLVLQRVIVEKANQRIQDVRQVNGIDPAGLAFRVPLNGLPTRDIGFSLPLPADGSYRLIARNLIAAPGPPAAYALSVGPGIADFDLTATPPIVARNSGRDVQPMSGIVLTRGACLPIELSLFRSGGFDGEVRVECQGLPPGVSGSASIPAGQSTAILFLSADKSAKAWAGAVKFIATADTSGGPPTHEAHYRTILWPSTEAEAAPTRACADFAFAVSEDSVALAMETPREILKLDRNRLHVPLKAAITSPVRIRPGGVPQLATVLEMTQPPVNAQQLIDVDLGPQRLAPGKYTIYLEITGVRRSKNGEEIVYAGPIIFEVPGRG